MTHSGDLGKDSGDQAKVRDAKRAPAGRRPSLIFYYPIGMMIGRIAIKIMTSKIVSGIPTRA